VEERRKAENASAKVGRPRIGGEFELVMPVAPSGSAPGTIAAQVEGRKVTHEDLKGAWTLVYFGFTNCACGARLRPTQG
jgi:protein SCO1/2